MSSTQARPKQVGSGYFISVGNNGGTLGGTGLNAGKFLVNTGSESSPLFSTSGYCVSSLTSTATTQGGIMKDMGKSLISSGRVFRKVQLMVSSLGIALVGSGPGNAPTPDYFTGYIELPNTPNTVDPRYLAQVARLG